MSPEQLQYDLIVIRGKEARHITDVLRLRVGDWVVLCDGKGARYRCTITAAKPLHVDLQRGERLPDIVLPVDLTLALAVIRPERFEWAVEKVVELGCRRVIPMTTVRTVTKYLRDPERQLERWREIALSAAKQSGLPWLPEVTAVTTLEQILQRPVAQRHYCWEGMVTVPPSKATASVATGEHLIVIGPEGGFTAAEHEQILALQPQPLPLGPLILRTETAALAAVIRMHYVS